MMDSPLVYLTLCSIRNRLFARLRRLREPRYLIGTVIGLAYFAYFFVILPARRQGRAGFPGFGQLISEGSTLVELGGASLLLVWVALTWIWPGSKRPALAFSRADVQFLFTAPISRRRLVRYRVVRSQIGAFFGSAIMTFFFRPSSFAEGWTFFLGLALVMGLINLHSTGVSLSRAASIGPGLAGLARRWAPAAIAAVAVATIVATLSSHWTALVALAAGGGNLAAEVARLGTTGLVGAVLWPFRLIARLPLADSPVAFLTALPWTLGAIWLAYVWVLRTDVAFEEASAELSEKMAKIRREGLSALRPPRKATATPFTLAAEGPIEIAILWKNLILMGRFLSWTLLLRLAPLVVFLSLALANSGGRGEAASFLAFFCLFGASFAVIFGPQAVRSDLRHDLASLALLKTWPVRGATLVRGEILAPAIVLSVMAALSLIGGALLTANEPMVVPDLNRWTLLIASLLVAPGIILVQLLVQNALAVSFPSWVSVGAPQRGGVDVMGQRLLMTVVSMLALVVVVLPAAIVGGLAALVGWAVLGTVPVLLPGILAAGTLQAEAFIGSEMVGAILDRTDVSAIDAPDA